MSDKEWAAKRGSHWAKVIADNVRSLREAAGLGQAELGSASGMVAPAISRIESGTHLPSLTTLLKVAEALDVEPGRLLEPPTPKKKTK